MGFLALLSDNDSDAIFVKEVARVTGLSFHAANSFEELESLIDASDLMGLFLSVSSIGILDSFESRWGGSVENKRVHVILSVDHKGIAEDVADFDDVGKIIIATYRDRPQSILDSAKDYSRVVSATMSNALGLRAFMPSECTIGSKVITESLQKRFIVEALVSQLNKRNWHPKMASSVAVAVDEMIMNAVFDAPIDEDGKQLYQTVPRSKSRYSRDRHHVEVQFGFDGECLGVSVIDKIGSLTRRNAFIHALKGYVPKNHVISRPEHLQGAGLGLALILRSGGSLSFNCRRGQRTEVTVFFTRADSSVAFKNQFQFVSGQFEA